MTSADILSIHESAKQDSLGTVCVMGLGYIGLPTAAILADRGYHVHGVDVRQSVIDTINRGEIHIHEPNLAELVNQVVKSGYLQASLSPVAADIYILCVPTPFHEDRSPDLTYVAKASEAIRPFVTRGNLIILESTSPPRTTADVVVPAAVPAGWEVGRDVFVAHCPERVLPGRILIEAVENDRVVGGMTAACTDRAVRFYDTFVTGEILPTTAICAELTKLVENSFRDVNIAFANELSILAEHFGANPFEVIELANHHPRVNILTPGPGVGGHCISVDPWFLVHGAPHITKLIRTAREVNDAKPHYVIQKIAELASQFDNPTIGCLGLAFKADVDDLRESPSLEIVRELHQMNLGTILACEPYVTEKTFTEFDLHSLDQLLDQSDVLVLLTDHQQFKAIPAGRLTSKTLVDTRGIWRSILAKAVTQSPSEDSKRMKRAA